MLFCQVIVDKNACNDWTLTQKHGRSRAVVLNTFESDLFQVFRAKTARSHVALREPNSGTESGRELFKAQSCSLQSEKFFVGGCGFFVSDVISRGLLATLVHFTWPWALTVRW